VLVDGKPVEQPINWKKGSNQFHVILFEDPNMPSAKELGKEVKFKKDPGYDGEPYEAAYYRFSGGSDIELQRKVVGGYYITVDYRMVPAPPPGGGAWMKVDGKSHSFQRDIRPHKNIRRLWSTPRSGSTLGGDNNYNYDDPNTGIIQAHPADEDFTNIGEIGMLFRKGAYYESDIDRPDRIGYGLNKEDQVRLDLADPNYHGLFKYLTVFDPTRDSIDNDGDGTRDEWSSPPVAGDELKIPGRININTAPWYVIAQLPWMGPGIAQAIVAYRDKTAVTDQNNVNIIDYSDRDTATGLDGLREEPGFASIGELATVINNSGEPNYSMHYYKLGLENGDLLDYPDLSSADGAADDFEERDVIFARISNLVTVRSDVFTAYILVRIGADGPQKRVIAILDRSNVYPPDGGKVRVVALHPVPDPR